jgi:NAD(P)-dependent dehydrogenase (short-subunit alcohol dehydrogenase family)
MARLAGKVAIITGSTSGMGEDTARLFVKEGARVVVTGRNEERGKTIAQSLGEDNAMFVCADVTNEADVVRLVATTVEHYGRIDCLFNNAAGPTQDAPVTEIDSGLLAGDMMNVFGSVVLMTKHVVPTMRASGGGSIINNGSTAAHRANSSPSVYSGLKAGVCHLSRCYAMELCEDGIRVNTISPGAIVTPIFAKHLGVPSGKEQEATEILSQVMGKALPVGRSGRGEDIAYAAIYLASDESAYVTAQDFVVDGGLTGGLSPSQGRGQWQQIQKALEPIMEK